MALDEKSNENLNKMKKYFQKFMTSGGILKWADPKDGAFRRQTSQFRNWISAEPGAKHPPEAGRYLLYVSYACPWVLIGFLLVH